MTASHHPFRSTFLLQYLAARNLYLQLSPGQRDELLFVLLDSGDPAQLSFIRDRRLTIQRPGPFWYALQTLLLETSLSADIQLSGTGF